MIPLNVSLRIVSTICLLLLAVPARAGGPLIAGFSESVFVSGLQSPVSIAWAPDGSRRLFVTEKAGGVRVIDKGSAAQHAVRHFPATLHGE
jgi:glucose/arabinose dehydrogenase